MNWKAWAPLVVAVSLALVAAFVATRMTSRMNVVQVDDSKYTKVAMVTRDLPPGTALQPEHLELREIHLDAPPEGTFTSTTELVDRVTTAPFSKGQPVLQVLLAPAGTGAGLQALVPKGMRAITIEVNEISGLAGMLLPGTSVDVLSTVMDNAEGQTARTVVQNVKVIAVGQRLTAKDPNSKNGEPDSLPRSVTLEVTPEQAEFIELSAVTGRPRLVLRADGDDKVARVPGISVVDLSGRKANTPPPAVPVADKPGEGAARPLIPFDIFGGRKPNTDQPLPPTNDPFATGTREVKIIRGGQESTVTFEEPRTPGWMTGVSLEPVVK